MRPHVLKLAAAVLLLSAGLAACSDGAADDAAATGEPATGTGTNGASGSEAGSRGAGASGATSGGAAGPAAGSGVAMAGRPGSSGAGANGADAGTSGQTRPFLLASAGTQLLIDGPSIGLQLTEADLAEDVDLVAVHQEFYGVPWQSFVDGSAPPAEWSARMQALADHAHAVSDGVFLSISMLNGARETLAERTVIEDGQPKGEDNWAVRCYDFATAADGAQMRAAYLRYVEHMVELFAPTYLNFAVEVNLFFEKCPDAVPGLIEIANAAYAAAKAKQPGLIAFPSIQIDHLYGVADDSCPAGMDEDVCFERNYAQLEGLERDRFAISSYPFLQGQSLADVPDDWFERAAARGGERALIAETGWLSTDLIAQNGDQCTTVISANEAAAAAYLERVLADADRIPLELVTWWSNRDLLPAGLMTNCPCDYEPTWCQVVDVFRGAAGGPLTPGADYIGEILLKAFGTMGIRDYDGKPKPALSALWNEARVVPAAR